jgi:quinol-cytochrome oxidoreductase complex cytochrome b subunit
MNATSSSSAVHGAAVVPGSSGPGWGQTCAHVPAAERFLLTAFCIAAAFCCIASWLAALGYEPSLEGAHSSVVYSELSNPAFADVRGMKFFAEQTAAACGILLLAAMWFRGGFESPEVARRWRWLLVTLGVFMAWSFFGQLLVMDQHAWHGTVVRAGIIESLPVLGPTMRDLLFGGAGITSTTLARFNALHVGFFAALLMFCAYRLYCSMLRCHGERTKIAVSMRAYVLESAAATLVMLGCLAVVYLWRGAYDVGIAARASTPDADVRPEWFFLPLSISIQFAPGKFAESVIAGAPGALGALLFLWPWLYKKFGKHARKAGAVASLGFAAVFISLLAYGVGRDAVAAKGYFAKPDIKAVMTEMGKLNKRLGYSGITQKPGETLSVTELAARQGEPMTADSWEVIADMIVLSRQTASLSGGDKVTDRDLWKQQASKLEQAFAGFWMDGPPGNSWSEIRRRAIRETCAVCHAKYDVKAELYDKPAPRPAKAPDAANGGAASGNTAQTPPAPWKLLPEKLAGLKPAATSKKLGHYMTDMLHAYKALIEGSDAEAAQAVVDLEAAVTELSARYEDDMGPKQDWDGWSIATINAARMVRAAKNAAELKEKLTVLRGTCNACHDGTGSEIDEDKRLPLPK